MSFINKKNPFDTYLSPSIFPCIRTHVLIPTRPTSDFYLDNVLTHSTRNTVIIAARSVPSHFIPLTPYSHPRQTTARSKYSTQECTTTSSRTLSSSHSRSSAGTRSKMHLGCCRSAGVHANRGWSAQAQMEIQRSGVHSACFFSFFACFKSFRPFTRTVYPPCHCGV